MPVAAISIKKSIPSYLAKPKVNIRFRVMRDGAVTPDYKIITVYRSFNDVARVCLALEALDGEFTASAVVDLATMLANDDWLVFGIDNVLPRRIRSAYLKFIESGTYTFNIASPVDKPEGFGYLAGEFPDGITTRLDTPISATIKVMHTAADGRMGKVAEVVSNPDGTWVVDNLDPSKQFDVICSLEGFNDLILSKVSPTPY